MSRPAHRGTIFDVLRGLSPSRTRTGFGRMVATTVAVMISLLLVGSAGPVYADDAGGTSAATTTASTTTDAGNEDNSDTSTDPASDPTAAPSVDPSATPDAPTADPTPSSAPSPTDTSSPGDTSTGGTTTKSSPMLQAALDTVTPLAVNCSTAVFGGFEVDGNTTVDCAKLDWDTPVGDAVKDGYTSDSVNPDKSAFTEGSDEGSDPQSWTITATNPMPNGKSDIGTAYAYAQTSGTDIYAYFGFTNNSTAGGTSQYDLEYNQNPYADGHGGKVPNRAPGDLLFRIGSGGSDALTFTDFKIYRSMSDPQWSTAACQQVGSLSSGWCTVDLSSLPDHSLAVSTSDTGTFVEGALDISLIFGKVGGCSGNYGFAQIRSVTGGSFYNASLKDYVAPMGADVPSTCSTIVINKQDLDGKPLGGATFKVAPNPASTDGTGSLTVEDNGGNDLDSTPGVIKIGGAEPGTYTVTETVAPPGYLLPKPDNQTLNVVKSSTATFTFKDPMKWELLTAAKTVTSSTYKRTYDWTLRKLVGASETGPFNDPGDLTKASTWTKNVPQDASGANGADFGYQITAHENGYADSDWTVKGKITVGNTNDAPVVANVSDSLPGATCTVDGATTAQVTVPANGSVSPSYECTFTAANHPDVTKSGTNTASVTWSKADYPNSQSDVGSTGSYSVDPEPTAGFTWSQTPVDKTVTLTDSKYDFGGDQSVQFTYGSGSSTDHVVHYTRFLSGTPGSCTDPQADDDATNVATLKGDTFTKTSTAIATVCIGQDLEVAKDAAPTLTRTYNWLVTKTSDDTKVTTDASGHATTHFTIHVEAATNPAYDDSDWAMTGAITVKNPNKWEDITLTDLDDVFSGTNAAEKTNPCIITDWDSVNHVIPQGGSRAFHYSCTFDEKPAYDGTNTATASWNGTGAATPTSSADGTVGVAAGDWDRTAVDDTADLYDDGGTGGQAWTKVNGTPLTWSPGLDQEFTYSMPVDVAAGTCEQFTNNARVMNNGVVLAGPAGASVTVCNELGLTVSKTATATLERTYHWTLSKTIADPSTVNIDGYTHTFDYTVTATPDGYTDGSYALSGSIHVANPNTDKTIDPITATVTDVPTGVGGGVSCVVNNGHNEVTLVSGDAVDLPYTCTFTGTPTTGTNVAHVTWDDGQSSADASATVAFTEASSVDKDIAVHDDKAATDGDVTLFTANWDDGPASTTYSSTFTAPDTACADFTNNAWITAVQGTVHLADASATATICPNTGTWKVVKSSTPDDGSAVDPGSSITYHVTVTKTGGVDPKHVVVVDDLTDVVDHAGNPTFTAPTGTTASYDSSTHELTWTIDELSGPVTLDYTVTVDQDARGATLVNHVTSTGSDNCPANPQRESADCTTTHYTPEWSLTKSSDPASGSQVMPGDTVTYTLTLDNTGPAALTGAQVQDDLSDVLDDASWNDDASTTSGSARLSGDTLTWNVGSVQPHQSVTLTYGVTVDDDAAGVTLHNVATPTTPGGSCATQGGCETTQHTPAWTLTKSSDPANHQQVLPGDTVTYTLTVDNTGPSALTGAQVQDNLAHVLDHASWNDDATTSSGSASLSGTALTWTLGRVEPGRSVTLTYSVTVDDDADGVTLHNVATPTTPGGSCVEDECDTSHHTPEWTLTKTSDPATGATVEPGETITYTLTVDNTGPAELEDAKVTDDLADVLPFAAGGDLQQPLAPGLSVSGSTLTWDVPDVARDDSASVSYSVVVADGAWGVTLENHATPETPGGSCTEHCSTTHPTPHYTLSKTSDPATGSTVMPPYLGAAGTTISYTLTAVNDSDGVVRGATVTDDLSDVLDNATLDDSSIEASGSGSASRAADTLTWKLPTLQPDDTATVTYTVTVDEGQWNATLHNVTTPDQQGSCALGPDQQPIGCDTTQTTPSYTQLAVKKVDAETGAALAGAVFTLTTADDPDTAVDTATTDSSGVAVFDTFLQQGDFVVTETKAPQGYDLPPAGDDSMRVTIDESNFVENGQMVPIEFRDPAQGQMALLPKAQYRMGADGGWVKMADSDTIDFGDEIRYVVPVQAHGPRVFHDVTVTDYVPGYNPTDTTSTTRATYVDGSATCTGTLAGCAVSFDPASGLLTWSIGTVTSADGAVEFEVGFPQLPTEVPYDANGDFTQVAANVGYLDWDEAVLDTTPLLPAGHVGDALVVPGADPGSLVHHELTSNQVVVTATAHLEVSPPPPPPHHHTTPPKHHNQGAPPPPEAPTLPNTGGPAWWYLPAGAGLVLLGAGLVLGQETRRRRRV